MSTTLDKDIWIWKVEWGKDSIFFCKNYANPKLKNYVYPKLNNYVYLKLNNYVYPKLMNYVYLVSFRFYLINPIPAGGEGAIWPPCSFFYITQKVLGWGCWNFLTFPTYPKPSL